MLVVPGSQLIYALHSALRTPDEAAVTSRQWSCIPRSYCLRPPPPPPSPPSPPHRLRRTASALAPFAASVRELLLPVAAAAFSPTPGQVTAAISTHRCLPCLEPSRVFGLFLSRPRDSRDRAGRRWIPGGELTAPRARFHQVNIFLHIFGETKTHVLIG